MLQRWFDFCTWYFRRLIYVSPGSSSASFTKLKNQVYDSLYSTGWILDGLIQVGLATTAGGMNKVYISQDVVQAARSVLFSTGTLTEVPRSQSLSVTLSWVNGDTGETITATSSMASKPVWWILCYENRNDTYQYQLYGVSTTKLTTSAGYSFSKAPSGDFYYYRFRAFGPVESGTVPVGAPIYSGKITNLTLASFDVTDVVASQDVILGSVATPNLSIAQGYADWYSNSINASDDPEDEKPMLPIGIPGLSIGNNTQSNAQSGTVGEDVVGVIVGNPSVPGVGEGSASGTVSNTSAIASINSWIRTISESLDSLIDWVISLPVSIAAALNLGAIIEWLESLGLSLSGILEWIIALPAAIADAISAVIAEVFVPSTDFVTTKVDAIKARFDWITPIVEYVDLIKSETLGSSVPVIYIHLDDTEGSYNIGGTVSFLDMSWYSRYKDQGDAILSGFLWALFLWRLFIKLPGIINGVGGDIGRITIQERKEY